MASGKHLRKDDEIYLVGFTEHQILGAKLPSNRQVLSVYFYNTRETKLNGTQSAYLVAEEVEIFYKKAGIPTPSAYNCMTKVKNLVEEFKEVQRNEKKTSEFLVKKRQAFADKLDDLFDMSHVDAMIMIKEPDVKDFLTAQREKGRVGVMLGVDKNTVDKEKRIEIRAQQERERKAKSEAEKKRYGD